MDALKYGDSITVDFAALPAASQFALAQRGFTHIFGNEAASRVHAWAASDGQAGAKSEGETDSDYKARVKAWKDANPDKVSAQLAVVQADFLDALNKGELGSRVGGPRLTPVETIANQMARKEIEDILRTNKIKVPKKDDKVKMPDGEFTMAELIARRLAKFGERINKAAAAEAARRAKATAAVTADAAAAMQDL